MSQKSKKSKKTKKKVMIKRGMICPDCQLEYSEDMRFCSKCGQPLKEDLVDSAEIKALRSSKTIIIVLTILCLILISGLTVGGVMLWRDLFGGNTQVTDSGQTPQNTVTKFPVLTEQPTEQPQASKEDEKEESSWWIDEEREEQEEEEDKNKDSSYLLPDSNKRRLTKADLEGLSDEELRYARNEIFARHGRIFGSESLNEYFEKKSWYEGKYTAEEFDESKLSDIERANIALIHEVESQ